MGDSNEQRAAGDGRTRVERPSDREVVVTRTFDAPPHIVFRAWTTPELFKAWWAPKSMGMAIAACEMDVRTGGGYSITFGEGPAKGMTFYGTYVEVVPDARLVWTNEEDPDGAVTTVTFEEKDGQTLLVLRDTYPSKEAMERAGGAEGGLPEQFAQLDELLAGLRAGEG